jgi:hypothetical protein
VPERGLAFDSHDFLYYQSNDSVARMDFPEAAPKIPMMVNHLCRVLQETFPSEIMLWIHSTGIWSELADDIGLRQMNLLRLGLGQTSDLAERPGHLFTRMEEADCIGMSVLPFIYGWDAYIIPADGRYFAYISHDEYVEVGFPDTSQAPAMLMDLGSLGPDIVTLRRSSA